MKRILNLGDTIDYRKDQSKIALIDTSRFPHRSYTFQDLDNVANGVARGLTQLSLPRGAKVAIVSDNSAEYLAAYFGILRAGLVAVLISPKFPETMIVNLLNHSQCVFMFSNLANFSSKTNGIPHVFLDDDEFEQFLDHGPFESVIPSQGEPAFLLYTSGSTGHPKGVLVSHQAHIWMVMKRVQGRQAWTEMQVEVSRQLIATPFFHMNGLITIEMSCAGHATAILLPKFEPNQYLSALEKYRASSLTVVPSMLAVLFENDVHLDTRDLSSVTSVHIGAAPITQSIYDQARLHFPRAAKFIINGYGLSEVGPGLFTQHPLNIPTPDLSVGYPTKGVDYRIVNGVLQIRSPSMMLGYLDDPEGSKKVITEDGFFVTGDRFRIDEHGFYYFIGRDDEMFICGGENIYPADVERILQTHPSVLMSVVISLPDKIKGAKPYAFVQLNRGMTVDEADLKAFFLNHAPAFMLPRRIWKLKKFPLVGLGKINRSDLVKRAADLLIQCSTKQEVELQ